MITWLTPAMIVGSASGSWMPRRICRGRGAERVPGLDDLGVDLADPQLGEPHARRQREDHGGDETRPTTPMPKNVTTGTR